MTEVRTDTSSGRFGGQWAFLSGTAHHHGGPGNARSIPPSSSYLRSDRSNVSPLSAAFPFQQLNASRSSLPRHAYTPSVGGHSSTTIPSQPVLVRVHSADANIQIHPVARPSRRRTREIMKNELPPIHEFSIEGILAAIQEDIEEDVNAISEILGRSRLVLADQHDSHMPPQGEIRAASSPLQAVAEATSSTEHLAADDVLILREDASLVEGSLAGSAAYGLLERLQTVPRTRRMRSDMASAPPSRPPTGAARNFSAPAVLPEPDAAHVDDHHHAHPHPHPYDVNTSEASRRLLPVASADALDAGTVSRATNAVVSETYLLAGANAVTLSDPPVVSEAGRHYPLYSYDYNEIFESPLPPPRTTGLASFRERVTSFLSGRDLADLTSWIQGRPPRATSAEQQLRNILERQTQAARRRMRERAYERHDMYE